MVCAPLCNKRNKRIINYCNLALQTLRVRVKTRAQDISRDEGEGGTTHPQKDAHRIFR
jgi:hypothetical protein